jgi:hypothetical protein
VRWELDEVPQTAVYCHCRRCQRRTGVAASASARVARESLRIVSGQEHVRTYAPPDGWEKLFCERCGSALFSRSPDGAGIGVRMGGFDEDPGVRPSQRQFVAYAAVWEPIPDDGLPRLPERAG